MRWEDLQMKPFDAEGVRKAAERLNDLSWPRWTLRSEHSEVVGSVEWNEDAQRWIVTVEHKGEIMAREHYRDRNTAFARSAEFKRAMIDQGWAR